MNSRNVITKHFDSGNFRHCPVCQHAIDADYDEALQYEAEHQLVEVIEPLDQDLVAEPIKETEEIHDFALVDPNKTLPPAK